MWSFNRKSKENPFRGKDNCTTPVEISDFLFVVSKVEEIGLL